MAKVDGVQDHFHELHSVLVVGNGVRLRLANLAWVGRIKEEDPRDLAAHVLQLDRDLEGDNTAIAVPANQVWAIRLDLNHVPDMILGQLVDGDLVVLLKSVDGLVAPSQEPHESKVCGLAVGNARRRQE